MPQFLLIILMLALTILTHLLSTLAHYAPSVLSFLTVSGFSVFRFRRDLHIFLCLFTVGYGSYNLFNAQDLLTELGVGLFMIYGFGLCYSLALFENGFCYENFLGFTRLPPFVVARDLVRAYPWAARMPVVFVGDGMVHYDPKSKTKLGDIWDMHIVGATATSADFEAFAEAARNISRHMPVAGQLNGQVSRYLSNTALEMPIWPRRPKFVVPHANRRICGDDEANHGHAITRPMNTVSALEASKVLLSGMEVLGSTEERAAVALDAFFEGIATSVPPSSPQYHRLLALIGPMRYSPRIEEHRAAGTIRRAALNHAITTLQGAIVGLISPSKAEIHAFPNAAIWDYTDALDLSRRTKHCAQCKAPTCAIKDAAARAGRVIKTNEWQRAAGHFKRFEVSSLLMINIEPNIDARTIVQLMVKAEVYNALSQFSIDWRALMGRKVYDSLTEMTTELAFGKVISSFHDGGDYVQDLQKVRQLFAPTYASGHSLRRTIIFGDHASQYHNLTLSAGGWATRCLPSYEHYYFIRLIMPDMTRPVVLVEKKGFDRVMATYRTQAIKDKMVARIVLRQSVVTYSISGTQVTPRITLSETEAQALGTWIEVYSEVQDALAENHSQELRPKTTAETVRKSIYASVATTLAATTTGTMALGAMSSMEALMRIYRTDIGQMTLDQMSERAMEEHFGAKIEPASVINVIVSAWSTLFGWVTSPKKWQAAIEGGFRESWALSFSYVDVAGVSVMLGFRYTIDMTRVLVDCTIAVARIMGKQEAVKKITAFLDYLDWSNQKMTRFWVAVQDAQDLDFQAAAIDIVETFFNVFAVDHAVDLQRFREKNLLPEEVVTELELNAALPYSDFLSEIKLFLGKFNSHVRRAAAASVLLNAFHHDCRSADAGQKAKMVHMLKKELVNVTPETVAGLQFALGGTPELLPIPLRPIDNQDIRECFKVGLITMPSPNGEYRLHRLTRANGEFDFSPIHRLMDLQHGATVNTENLAGPNYISPDARGAQIQHALIEAVVAADLGARICNEAAMVPWYQAQLAAPTIDYVAEVLRKSEHLFTQPSARNWLAHITGLAMGGKSKVPRTWISVNDLVVVPTRELKEEWQSNLGKLEPLRRATVVTQHEALVTKYASRYVIIDECYAFDPEHLQAIANRHHRSKGVITIGDRRQISNVFSPTQLKLVASEAPCVMITPTTFVGWDSAVTYLHSTVTDTFVEDLFCGTDDCESLCYTLTADDTLLPGEGDIAMQGTQIGKEMVLARGVRAATVHECQGRRSEFSVIHGLGKALGGDLRWLGMAEQAAHCAVGFTRARKKTIFVVEGVSVLTNFRWFDDTSVNGRLPDTVIMGGTSWDFCEVRAENESTWLHIHEPALIESSLIEQPLTDLVTIATVFDNHGEPLSSSEIHTNVELVSGVSFRDEGIANSDAFDNYTIQPRDIPGADQVQALTRSVPEVRTRAQDYVDAEKIVEWLFEEVIDKKLFFAHVNNSRRAAITRQSRQQAIDGAYANYETAASTLSFAFLKPEFAKKPSELIDGPSELKAQGVVSASDLQQAIFADTCDALTHAWARSMQKGKLSPVGLREEEVEDFLATFETTVELDIEKQDSSHRPVHIIVASIFLEFAADKLGLGALAHEIRNERRVRMMGSPFKFVLQKSLASGDPWTLIINKIMAFSSLISVARLKDVRTCQSGDDVTMDRMPEWRGSGIKDQAMANAGLTWKMEERDQRRNGVTFISRAVLPHRTVVYKALRTILKYAFRKRNQIQHAGIAADASRIQALAARHGLQAYAEARCQVWGGDPVVVFDLWTRALAVARSPFENLPIHLRSEEPRQYTVRERNGGCFGYALANCVRSNVAAINAIASYRGPVNQTLALKVCRDNKVPLIIMNERFAQRSRKRLMDQMDRRKISRSFVVVYEDHAVAVVPNTITLHGAFGKRSITWKNTFSKDVEISDFE